MRGLLRASPAVSLIAERDGVVVGHIFFSPATLVADSSVPVMGLAPMAVLPEHQRSGVGSALVRDGLDACRRLGAVAVIVLGHVEYYPRFGFQPASRFGIRSEYDVLAEAFMAIELVAGALAGTSGRVRYHEEFAAL